MHYVSRTISAFAASALLLALGSGAAMAQKKNDTGATDTEIKIGNIAPYSGPASSYATIAKTEAAYFKMINEAGGINGRKINFISYDDGYSPPKTVEQVRKLVESDEVFAIFQVVGTPGNSAIAKYLNQKGVPHTFVGSGATKWADPKNQPWSMGWQPNYQSEARIYARYIQKNYPGKTVGILYQNDDFGKDYLTGFNEAFGADKSKIVVAEVPYEVSVADGGFAGGADQGRQPGHLRQHRNAEVRRAGDQEDRRDEMDAGAVPHQRLGLGRPRS